jgi:hypothetical protein
VSGTIKRQKGDFVRVESTTNIIERESQKHMFLRLSPLFNFVLYIVIEHIIPDILFHFNPGENLKYCASFSTLIRNAEKFFQISPAKNLEKKTPKKGLELVESPQLTIEFCTPHKCEEQTLLPLPGLRTNQNPSLNMPLNTCFVSVTQRNGLVQSCKSVVPSILSILADDELWVSGTIKDRKGILYMWKVQRPL